MGKVFAELDNVNTVSRDDYILHDGANLCSTEHRTERPKSRYNINPLVYFVNQFLYYRCLYMLACIFNTIAMMCSTLVLVVVVLIPAATYVGRYHIMAIVILGAAILGTILICKHILYIQFFKRRVKNENFRHKNSNKTTHLCYLKNQKNWKNCT